MSVSFLAAADARCNASALRAAFAQPAAPAASPLALMMRADLAAGRLTVAEYVQESRQAGVSLLEITATLKNHMNAQKNTDSCNPATVEDVVLPAGTYYGRKHATPVHVVDGIFVPVTPTGPAAADAVATSLAWLREHGGAWGPRAAERLGPENDFMHDLELIAEAHGYLVITPLAARELGGCASSGSRGSARTRLLRLLGAHLAAPGGSVLPGVEASPLGAQALPRVLELDRARRESVGPALGERQCQSTHLACPRSQAAPTQ